MTVIESIVGSTATMITQQLQSIVGSAASPITQQLPAIVGSTASLITQQLRDEAVFLRGSQGKLEWIRRELSQISRYLKDADRKAREGNDSIKAWVVDVMGVAHDADDAITFFVWMEEQRKRRTLIGKCLFLYRDLLNLHKANVLIEAVEKNIKEISTSRSNLRLEETSGRESHEASSSRLQQYRIATTDFEEQLFVGFERDMDELRGNLITGDPRRRVVSIVGMGGAGKTTLARKLYNDSNVKAHFESNIAWVCVSQKYNIKELLQEIAKQVRGLEREDCGELTDSQLRKKLQGFLKQCKYLIVVDDIWNKEAWDLLRGAFPDGNEGSRILLTTRIEDVGLYADRLSRPHKLPLLNERESWDLFLNIVFPPQEENDQPICPDQLEGIARQMVGKCGGLPLAIKVLGGLSFTTSEDATVWRKVLDHHLKWQLSGETGHLSDILALSYLDLPDYLKACFLYLGIFPEDYEIPAEILTRLWIAEGFIQERERSSKEDVAEQCFAELAKRSMIQVTHLGRISVHDMLRDLAIKEAKGVGLFEIDDDLPLFNDVSASTSTVTRVHRLGIHGEDYNRLLLVQSRSSPKIRSFLCFADRGLLPKGLGRAKWLRVLHLDDLVSDRMEVNEISELVYLKYLRVDGIGSLPPCIDKLYNLQTLDLGWTFIRLPAAIWSLQQLRHLIAHRASFDERPQPELLQQLHTLALMVGKWIEVTSLVKLSKLRNLCITEVYADRTLDKFGEASIRAIQGMVHLQRLQLNGKASLSVVPPFMPFDDNSRLEELILNGVTISQEQRQISFEFPPMLTRLQINGTQLKDDPMPTLGKLKNLRFLTFGFDAYHGTKLTMPEKGFLQLKRIHFEYLFNLEEWIVEEGAMPTLKHLKVYKCEKLKMLPRRLQNITALKELVIDKMPTEFCQRLMEHGGEDWYKIQHVPSVTIYQ